MPTIGPSQPSAGPAAKLQQFERVEREIARGQLPAEQLPGFLARHPEFAAWYQDREAERAKP